MNIFARFNENPAMTLQDIKETKRYGRTDGHTDGRTHTRTDNVKTVYPLQTKFAGGIKKVTFDCLKTILSSIWFLIRQEISLLAKDCDQNNCIQSQTHKKPIKNAHRSAQNSKNSSGRPPKPPLPEGE